MLAKAFKRARTTGTWAETAAAQGESVLARTRAQPHRAQPRRVRTRAHPLHANATQVTKAVLEGAPAGAIFALLDCNELTEEKWREVFVERCPATDSVPAHFKLLSGDTRKVLDEPYQGCPGGVIADEPEEHSLFAEFGMYYKSPEIAPLAQPANPLEATTGEATTGAGAAPTGGAPAVGTRRHGDAH